jgi:hypothetical protein
MKRKFTTEEDPQRRERSSAAKLQWNSAKRMECEELAPAFEPPPPYDSASKLDALQTLRVAIYPSRTVPAVAALPRCAQRVSAVVLPSPFADGNPVGCASRL